MVKMKNRIATEMYKFNVKYVQDTWSILLFTCISNVPLLTAHSMHNRSVRLLKASLSKSKPQKFERTFFLFRDGSVFSSTRFSRPLVTEPPVYACDWQDYYGTWTHWMLLRRLASQQTWMSHFPYHPGGYLPVAHIETLQNTVHVTRVAKIGETRKTSGRFRFFLI